MGLFFFKDKNIFITTFNGDFNVKFETAAQMRQCLGDNRSHSRLKTLILSGFREKSRFSYKCLIIMLMFVSQGQRRVTIQCLS